MRSFLVEMLLLTSLVLQVDCSLAERCGLPPVTGQCKAAFPRYYFNGTQSSCVKFTYGGCQGNANNFVTAEACTEACAQPVPAVVANSSLCVLPPVTGECQGWFPRYYFDGTQSSCVEFTYGGCQGNANNFETAEACTEACAHTVPAPALVAKAVQSDGRSSIFLFPLCAMVVFFI